MPNKNEGKKSTTQCIPPGTSVNDTQQSQIAKKDTLHISQAHIYTCAYTEPHIDTDAALKWPN